MSPHTITIDFSHIQKIAKLGLFINYRLDRSYTPKLIRIRASISAYEDEIICQETIDRYCGWKIFDLKPHQRQYLALKKYYKNKQKRMLLNLYKKYHNNNCDDNNKQHVHAKKRESSKPRKH